MSYDVLNLGSFAHSCVIMLQGKVIIEWTPDMLEIVRDAPLKKLSQISGDSFGSDRGMWYTYTSL